MEPDQTTNERQINKRLVLVLAIVLVGGAGIVYALVNRSVDTDKLFMSMLNKQLRLNSYRTKATVLNTYRRDEPFTVQAEVSDTGKALASHTVITGRSQYVDYQLETSQSPQGMFAKVASYTPPEAPAAINPEVLGKWAKLDETPHVASAYQERLEWALARNHTRTGEVPIGYFNYRDRKALTKMIRDNKMYRTIAKPVRIRNEGREVYRYQVKIALADLKKLNEAAAKRSGEDFEPIRELYNVRETTTLGLDIDLKTQQLVRQEIFDNEGTSTVITYSDHNKVPAIQAPSAKLKAVNLIDLISKVVR